MLDCREEKGGSQTGGSNTKRLTFNRNLPGDCQPGERKFIVQFTRTLNVWAKLPGWCRR